MLYLMNAKDLLDVYINEPIDDVKETQYIIVSSSIKTSKKYKKQILRAGQLFPSNYLIMEYDDYKTNKSFIDAYKEQLEESVPLLASIIKYSIEEYANVVILCGKREQSRLGLLNVLSEFIRETFDYVPLLYTKKNRTPYKRNDEEYVVKQCNRILKDTKKAQKSKVLNNENTRKKYIASLSKEKMKQILKKMDMYQKGMGKAEMVDMLETFYYDNYYD